MKKILLGASALAFALASLPATAGTLVNGGFENPIGPEWFVTPNAGRAMSITNPAGITVTPCGGKWFGFADGGALAGSPGSLTQTIALTAGQTVRGCVGFLGGDYLPFDDKGYFTVFDGDTTQHIMDESISTVGDYGWTGWMPWSFTATITAAHTFELGMENIGDNVLTSWAVLDTVPEPATWAMLILGFGLVGHAARRRRTGSVLVA
jgi:hypothetical protein